MNQNSPEKFLLQTVHSDPLWERLPEGAQSMFAFMRDSVYEEGEYAPTRTQEFSCLVCEA
jgi:hypothetical protein